MRFARLPFAISALLLLLLSSCKKEIEADNYAYQPERLTELQPLQVGKYIIYRLDSTVFTNSGRSEEVHSYQEKHEVNAQVSDNLGRPSYRIFRFLRDTLGVNGWTPNGSYYITVSDKQVEYIDDNLRTIKLMVPLKENFNWKGNKFLALEPYADHYSFNNDNSMELWDYNYTGVNETVTINGKVYDSTTTVVEVDEATSNVPIIDPKVYAAKSLSVNKFSKGIGLVWQEYVLWEYDVTTQSTPFRLGFGVKRTILAHN